MEELPQKDKRKKFMQARHHTRSVVSDIMLKMDSLEIWTSELSSINLSVLDTALNGLDTSNELLDFILQDVKKRFTSAPHTGDVQ